MEIDYIKGSNLCTFSGISRYQLEITSRLKGNINPIEYEYSEFKLGRFDMMDTLKRYLIYPFKVKMSVRDDNVKHINDQRLSFLLEFINPSKSIITCYDLIPWVFDNNHSLFWKINLNAMKRADRIITISQYSKNDINKYLDFPKDNIDVVYPAVDHENYYKKKDNEIIRQLNISEEYKTILYVGSEQPRQNVDVIIKSFAKLKKQLNNVKLLKIGIPQFIGAREKNLKLIEDLNLSDDIIFIDNVSEQDLPRYYNASDLFVYPCSYAGFGLPPLEAMACGVPVITSNTTSLPEVVGDAGITINPTDSELLASKMYHVLTNDDKSDDMIRKGLKRAKMFRWDIAAEKTAKIYKKVYENSSGD